MKYRWFDVTVDDFTVVKVFEATQNLTSIVDQCFIRKRHIVTQVDATLQTTIAKFHYGNDSLSIVGVETGVKIDDISMAQTFHQFNL